MSLVFAAVVMSLSIFVPSAQTGSKPDLRENAETSVSEAVRVLESKDYKTFLVQFVPPEQVKARGGSPDQLTAWVEMFSTRADGLLAALKSAATQKPTYDQTGTVATFPLNGQGGPSSLRMVRIGKHWYIGDK